MLCVILFRITWVKCLLVILLKCMQAGDGVDFQVSFKKLAVA